MLLTIIGGLVVSMFLGGVGYLLDSLDGETEFYLGFIWRWAVIAGLPAAALGLVLWAAGILTATTMLGFIVAPIGLAVGAYAWLLLGALLQALL